jgi:predicted DNA-binding transcriptional regulator AlpA
MDKLLRIEAVSEMTGIPVPTLRMWRGKKEGPLSAKLGRRVVYRERDVIAWVNAQFDQASV